MSEITVTVPDKFPLGRTGLALECDWSRVPRVVLDHIAATYFPQAITDRANSEGKDSTPERRKELAEEKIAQFYSGTIRARGESREPVNPIEAIAYRAAKADVVAFYKSTPEAKAVPKGTKNVVQWIMDARDTKAGREPRDLEDVIVARLEAEPAYYEEAVKAYAKAQERIASLAAMEEAGPKLRKGKAA